MFLLKAFIKTKILHAVEFPTIDDALKYASLLEKNNRGIYVTITDKSDNKTMEKTKVEKVKQSTNNYNIRKFNLNNISENNLEPFVRTMESFHERYYSKNYELNLKGAISATESFLYMCFWDNTPELREDVTLNQIYNYFNYVAEKNKDVIIDWLTVFNNAFRIFGKKED